jgi:hypothetical protein
MPKQGTQSFLSLCVPKSIQATALTFFQLQYFRFLSVDIYKPPCIEAQFKMKRRFTNGFPMPVEPLATAAGPLEVCGLP